MKYTGVVDLFRMTKPGAAIYQAQTDPAVTPVIAPAFYWDFGLASPVTSLASAMICSNLDRLEIYVGGEHFATATPDTGDYSYLDYPPSFVDFSAVDGSSRPGLRIDGSLGSVRVASRSLAFRAVDRYGAPGLTSPGRSPWTSRARRCSSATTPSTSPARAAPAPSGSGRCPARREHRRTPAGG